MTNSSINHALALQTAAYLFASTEPSRKLEATLKAQGVDYRIHALAGGRIHKIGRWPKSTVEEARKECQAMRHHVADRRRRDHERRDRCQEARQGSPLR